MPALVSQEFGPRGRRSTLALGAVVAALSLISLAAWPAPSAAPAAQAPGPVESRPVDPIESGPLVAAGPAPDLVLLYTGGVVGYIEPCG